MEETLGAALFYPKTTASSKDQRLDFLNYYFSFQEQRVVDIGNSPILEFW